MRSLGNLFQQKQEHTKTPSEKRTGVIDSKTLFFLFEKIVREYYGKRGGGVIHPHRYEEKVLFVKVASPLWANELVIQGGELCRRLNEEVGNEVVVELRVLHGLHAD